MIYLNNIDRKQTVWMPKPYTGLSGEVMHLRIWNTVDLSVYFDADVKDTGLKHSYWGFEISLSESIPQGSYEYELTKNDDVLSAGCIMVEIPTDGDMVEYNETVEYSQYGGE